MVYYWTAYSHKNRFTTIQDVEGIVSKFGSIVDFKQFSDITTMIHIELIDLRVPKLYEVLKEYMVMDDFNIESNWTELESTVYLNINFSNGTWKFNSGSACTALA